MEHNEIFQPIYSCDIFSLVKTLYEFYKPILTVGLFNTLTGVIVGGIIGLAGGYWNAVKLSNLNAKRLAAIELRKAFVPTLVWLKSADWSKEHTVSTRLETDFILHSIAIDAFGIYLSGNQLREYNKTWLYYYGYDDEKFYGFDKSLTYMQRLIKYDHCDNPNGHNEAIKNIEAILSFTLSSSPAYTEYPLR